MATSQFRSERAYLEAYLQGWKPVRWESVVNQLVRGQWCPSANRFPAKGYAALRMSAPEGMNAQKAHRLASKILAAAFESASTRAPCQCCFAVVVTRERPRTLEHERAQAEIEALLGLRPER